MSCVELFEEKRKKVKIRKGFPFSCLVEGKNENTRWKLVEPEKGRKKKVYIINKGIQT